MGQTKAQKQNTISGPNYLIGLTDDKHANETRVKIKRKRKTLTVVRRTTPDHAGIRPTTPKSTRTLTRATESTSNNCIGRLMESASSIKRDGELNRKRKSRAHPSSTNEPAQERARKRRQSFIAVKRKPDSSAIRSANHQNQEPATRRREDHRVPESKTSHRREDHRDLIS
ncbi:hypothetical protein YC2023_105646 [Brassica napus]